jgi:hypothetical protein
MIADIPSLLRALMGEKPNNINQTQLAALIGGKATQPYVAKWLSGTKPDPEYYLRIIELARQRGIIDHIESAEVAESLDPTPVRKVKVKGYVGAGSRAHYYALADEEFDEVDAPLAATDKTVAVEIRGKSLGPLLNSWLVFYDDVRSPVTDDLVGHLCVVGLSDDRILVKQIARNRQGSYDLISNTDEEPIRGVTIEWAARVTDLRPRF